jgi:hypothetical protein
MNFIIADICNSYGNIKINIDALIYKEKAILVHEAEVILPNYYKTNRILFPKYIISKEIEI